MERIEIIIADQESELYYPMALALINEYDDDTVNISIETNVQNLSSILARKEKIDILLVDEKMYVQVTPSNSIPHTIVLMDQYPENEGNEEGIVRIYRYSKQKSLLNLLISAIEDKKDLTHNVRKDATIIMVSSVAGGVGKTVSALAVTRELNHNHKKALYINSDMLQTFTNYIESHEIMDQEVLKTLILSNGYAEKMILNDIKSENGIQYVPPMRPPLLAFDKDKTIYLNMIKDIKDSGIYRYIVVDTDSLLDRFKTELIQLSEEVIMISDASRHTSDTYNEFINNVNLKNAPKIICNCGVRTNEEQELSGDNWDVIIPPIEGDSKKVILDICELDSFREMIYMIL